MIGKNLKPEKPLFTKKSLEYNDTERCCQLWQEVKTLRLERPTPISRKFVDKKCDLFMSVSPNTEKRFLLKIATSVVFKLPLLNSCP